jgi:hypothetical protein
MIKELKDLFEKIEKKNQDPFSNSTDDIAGIKDIIPNQKLNTRIDKIFENCENTKYLCLRDNKGICIYVANEDFEKFMSISFVAKSYSQDGTKTIMVNITNLLKFTIDEDVIPIIATTVPQDVEIKFIKKCRVRSIDIYYIRYVKLEQNDQLFKDLINLKLFKDKHGII